MQFPAHQTGRRRLAVSALALTAVGLAGCRREATVAPPPIAVRVTTVAVTQDAPTVTLTGEIRPRIQSDLSFRATGRIIDRQVDVGAHVEAGQVLAVIDPKEQEADVASAAASVESAEAQLRQVSATYERQKALLARGFTTRRDYDQAEESLRVAQAALKGANAQLGVARDQLAHTVLRSDVAGIVTARHAEAGQVVQAAQPVFTIAHDGARDAVFQVHETVLAQAPPERGVEISLLSDSNVRVTGAVREIAPAVNAATGTITVKVGLDAPPPAMTLGAAVTGVGRLPARPMVILPWDAMTLLAGKPSVWLVDPRTNAVAPQPVTVARFDSRQVVISAGLTPGQIVVTTGAQLLRPGQIVSPAKGAAS
ncbi:MAG TPA: efflux RND transporter periplasmic adaptor subunit [Vineibacter sp.]|nr:efflux RND transporter periplasmic adaptor subunit [Vineibacter sp.]